MSCSRPLCLTALLASLASSAVAADRGSGGICPAGDANEAGPSAMLACTAATAPPSAIPFVMPAPTAARDLALDCSPLALGGLVSGPGAGGVHASQLVSATLRQCSRRGFVFGVARHAPPPRRGSADTRQRLG